MAEKYELQYVIKGDASGMRAANAELAKFDKNTGAASMSLTSLAGPAGFAAGSIAILATAAVGAGIALYGLAKSASDYGSEIFDASEKTGLGAETLTAMKLAAEQSSSSLEEVTNGISKFSKLVGEAALGSDKAAAALTRLGVDPQDAIKDLDGALGTVFKRIAALPPGVQQSKAAMDAFGKAGANLLPFIKSFNGDLPGLIAKAKELGVTLSDQDARAADEFGDQMDTLNAQLKMVAVTFGQELMPVFKGGAEYISGWLSKNKGEIRDWGKFFADTVSGAASAMTFTADVVGQQSENISAAIRAMTFGLADLETILNIVTLGGHRALTNARAEYNRTAAEQAMRKAEMDAVTGVQVALAPGSRNSGYLDDIESQKSAADKARKDRLARAKRDSQAELQIWQSFARDQQEIFQESLKKSAEWLKSGGDVQIYRDNVADAIKFIRASVLESDVEIARVQEALGKQNEETAKERELRLARVKNEQNERDARVEDARIDADKASKEEAVKREQDTVDRQKDIDAAYLEQNLAQLDASLSAKEISEAGYAQAVADLRDGQLETDQVYYRQLLGLASISAEQRKEIEHKLAVSEIARKTESIKSSADIAAAKKREADAVRDLADALDEAAEAWRREREEYEARRRAETTVGSASAISSMGELRGLAVDNAANHAGGGFFDEAQNQAAIAGVDALAAAFDGLGQAVGTAVSAYVLYGSAGASVQQVTAQILAGIAQQAAVKAVFELAEGFAMLALAFFGHPGAGPSATQHFAAAAVYGGIAGIAAVAGRAVAGDSFKSQGAGAASSSGGNSQGASSNAPTRTYTRTSEDAYMSGNRPDARLADAIDRFINKFDPVSPGKVLMSGIRQSPGVVGNAVVQDNRRNPSVGKTLLRNSGIK